MCMCAKAESFFFSFKFYVLMQSKTMKHDAIYLNSSTEALCVCNFFLFLQVLRAYAVLDYETRCYLSK